MMRHIACVDAYEGLMEPGRGSNAPGSSAPGLGLPWRELASMLNADITLLTWDDWYAYETRPGSIASWTTFPATRLATPWTTPRRFDATHDPRVQTRPIPALDPEHQLPLSQSELSPRAFGLLADGDPLLLLSWLVRQELFRLHAARPLDLVIVPMWGGLGYLSQLDRATTEGALRGTSFGVVVTSTSHDRLTANEEGVWTRSAIARRQREELSLALAEVTLVFGPRAAAVAERARVRGAMPPVLAPRHVAADLRERLRAAQTPSPALPSRLVTAAPCDGASGTLDLLHAARTGGSDGQPIVCLGADMTFAPMAPRTFRDYWSSRAWVRELMEQGRWTWGATTLPAQSARDIRLHMGSFSHLTDLWSDAANGHVLALSATVADEVGCGDALPGVLLAIANTDGAARSGEVLRHRDKTHGLATYLQALGAIPAEPLEQLRQSLCAALLGAVEGAQWQQRLERTAAALHAASPADVPAIRLSHALQRQRDPRVALCSVPVPELSSSLHAGDFPGLPASLHTPPAEADTLTVVIPCLGMGPLVRQTVESVWQSSRVPDEILLVDDGSVDTETAAVLTDLAKQASRTGAPLRIIRQENRGLAAARNVGLAAAGGTFVSFLDGDDLILPPFYELALDLLRRDPGLGGVGTWAELFGDGVADGFWNAPQPELPLLLVENQVIVPVVTRTALLRSLGGYDERFRYNYEDWELSIRYLAMGHCIATIPRYLMRYRVRRDSLYRSMTATQNQVMRELLMSSHGPTIASFAQEVAMQLEHRLAQRVYDQGRNEPGPASPFGAARKAAGILPARLLRMLAQARAILSRVNSR